MAIAERGPAYDFWLAIQRALDRTDMSLRELVDRSGVTATTISRLKTSPPRDRRKRRQIVEDLATALNDAAHRQGKHLPFPDGDEVLRLAGLIEQDPGISVRESVRRSAEYDPQQKAALLGLLDALDAANQRTRRADNAS